MKRIRPFCRIHIQECDSFAIFKTQFNEYKFRLFNTIAMTYSFKRKYFGAAFLLFSLIANYSFSQDLLPKLDQIKSLQRDTNTFYFKEIWLKSKDINTDDPAGYMRRASSKLESGYLKEALLDVNKAISIDSSIGETYSLKGYILFRYDSVKSALDNFNKSLALKDTNIYNYYYQGEIYSKAGNSNEAEFYYNKAVQIDKSFSLAYFGLANLYYLNFRFKEAEEYYKKVIELNPSFSIAYFNMAVMYLDLDQNKAMKNLNKTIEISPDFAQAYYIRGYLERALGKISATYKDWNKAIELDQDNNLYHTSLGILYITDKNYLTGFNEIIKAITLFKLKNFFTYFEQSPREKITNDFISQAVTFNSFSARLPGTEKEKIINALCSFFLGKFKISEEIYSNLISSTSQPGLVHYLRGFNLEYLHDAESSLESYAVAAKQSIFPPEADLRTGIVYNFLGKYREAIPHLNSYIESNDSTRLAYRSLAASYLGILKYDSAILVLNRLIKHDSTELDIYFDRAFCFKTLLQHREAIRDYNHILKYSPNHPETVCNLAECRYSIGDTIGAYTILNQEYNLLHFLTEEGFFLRGSINLGYMKYDTAIVDFNEVLNINPKHIDAFIFRGLCYFSKGDLTHAKSDLSSAIKLNNNDMTALYTRGIINIKLNNLKEAYEDLTKAETIGHPLSARAIKVYLKDYRPDDNKRTNQKPE